MTEFKLKQEDLEEKVLERFSFYHFYKTGQKISDVYNIKNPKTLDEIPRKKGRRNLIFQKMMGNDLKGISDAHQKYHSRFNSDLTYGNFQAQNILVNTNNELESGDTLQTVDNMNSDIINETNSEFNSQLHGLGHFEEPLEDYTENPMVVPALERLEKISHSLKREQKIAAGKALQKYQVKTRMKISRVNLNQTDEIDEYFQSQSLLHHKILESNEFIIEQSFFSHENYKVYLESEYSSTKIPIIIMINPLKSDCSFFSGIFLLLMNYLQFLLKLLCFFGLWNTLGKFITDLADKIKLNSLKHYKTVYFISNDENKDDKCQANNQNANNLMEDGYCFIEGDNLYLIMMGKRIAYSKIFEFIGNKSDCTINFESTSNLFLDQIRKTEFLSKNKSYCCFLESNSLTVNSKFIYQMKTSILDECASLQCGSCCTCHSNPIEFPEDKITRFVRFFITFEFLFKILNILIFPISKAFSCKKASYILESEKERFADLQIVKFILNIGETMRVKFLPNTGRFARIFTLSTLPMHKKDHRFLNLPIMILTIAAIIAGILLS